MKNLNERQTKLITELQDAFGKMNGSTTANGRLLDIQSIRNVMDESEAIKREVALYNDKLRGEFHCKFRADLEMLSDDLEELGLFVEMYESKIELWLSIKHLSESPTGCKKPFTTNSIYRSGNTQFIITGKMRNNFIDLPNGEKIAKLDCYYYELGYRTNNNFRSIEDLVNFYLFNDWINYSLVQNNKYKN